MAKAAVTKKISVTAEGVLNLDEHEVKLEIDSGTVDLCALLADFDGQPIKISVNYIEDYE
jgi:Ethanolamine utilization protein EutJ (predicted chaperonin)